jgi:hypothetical protein
MKTTFEVVRHPLSKNHLLFKVTTKSGYVYACASAWEPDVVPRPCANTVQYLWKHSQHDFLPYDESTGHFVNRRVAGIRPDEHGVWMRFGK